MTPDESLAALWPTLNGTVDEKLTAVNALMVDGQTVDVSVSAVSGYLALHLKLAGLFAYADNPPSDANSAALVAAKNLAAVLRLANAPSFNTANTQTYSVLEASLSMIASDPKSGLTPDDVTALMKLAQTKLSWVRSVGYQQDMLSQDDLIRAGVA
jgi:hypothetical protein